MIIDALKELSRYNHKECLIIWREAQTKEDDTLYRVQDYHRIWQKRKQ